MVWIAWERAAAKMCVKRPGFVGFGVNRESTNPGDVCRL
jgi:hypothetical protein